MKELINTSWMKVISEYNHPDPVKSWTQLITNLLLYAAGFYLMILSLSVSYWLSMILIVPVAGIMVRIFIIFHDCGHGSFFKSRRLNTITGFITGILVFTPYLTWSKNHMIHHKTAGNLDKRGVGDVWTLTVKEYLSSSTWQKLKYRMYRNPITLFGIGSFLVFMILQRFTHKDMDATQKLGVYLTNGGLLVYISALSYLIGLKTFLIIQFPLMYVAGIIGLWLFYVQHQFDPSYWTHNEEWNYERVAMEGSSFYKLPAILRWFTGSIGYHHVHHLSPKIPNYNLKKCHNKNEIFKQIKPLGFRRSLHALRFHLWDEEKGRMVGFREVAKA